MDLRRWMLPAVAAIAVAVVVGAAVWLQQPDPGDAGFAGSSAGSADSTPYTGPRPGSESPSAGPAGPASPAPGGPASPAPGGDPRTDGPGTIAVDGYYAYDATHLALNYANGVPECYGRAGTPVVEERADAVVVTIPRTRVAAAKDRVCIDLAVLGSVDVRLTSPLAGRKVLDGSRDGAPVPPAAAPNQEDQAK